MDRTATQSDAARLERTRGRGVTLSGRYRLDHQIAVGGMGEVWSATDQVLDRRVAVKLLRGDIGDDPTLLRRFRAEARHAAAVAHPAVARVYDYGEDALADSVAFLVMEIVDGQPLSVAARGRPMNPTAVIGLLTQAADGLGAAHAVGLVHRDVKPGNLLLSSNGVLKITDFGIAHAIGSAAMTDDGKVAGTARYMSPEQAVGAPVTASSDVYSLAVVGYQLLAGHTPFDGAPAAVALEHVRSLPPPLPAGIRPDLRALITRSLDKDPTKRPANGDVMSAELRALADAPAVVPPSDRSAAAAQASTTDPHTATVLDATRVWPAQAQLQPTQSARSTSLVDATRWHRQRRRLGVVVTVLCAAALGILALRAAASPGPTGELPASWSTNATTTDTEPAPATTTPTVAVPAATTTPPVVAEPTGPPTAVTTAAPPPGKGNGKNANKGNGKDKG